MTALLHLVAAGVRDMPEGDYHALTWQECAATLQLLRQERADILATERELEAHIAKRWAAEHIRFNSMMPVEGVGAVVVRTGTKRTAWDHDAVLPAVIKAHLIDAGGEIPDPFTLARWVTDACGVAYWRAGVLRGLGIEPDEFCTTDRRPPTVQITGGPK